MIPQKAIDLIKHFEGLGRKIKTGSGIMVFPYLCPAGFWTIGYGHRCNKMQKPITEEEAEGYLKEDLRIALSAVLKYCPVLAIENENKLSAIIDFTFNLGPGRLQTSTLRRRINQRDWEESKKELLKWVHSRGKILPGLVLRRKAEADLL